MISTSDVSSSLIIKSEITGGGSCWLFGVRIQEEGFFVYSLPFSVRRLYFRKSKLSKFSGFKLSLFDPRMFFAVLKTLSDAADPGGAPGDIIRYYCPHMDPQKHILLIT